MRLLADDGTQVTSMPTITSAVGTPGYFTEGDPASGLAASTVSAAFLNMLMSEVANVIKGGGLTLDDTGQDLTQLIKSISLIGRRQNVWSTAGSYSWVVPSGVYRVVAEGCGGGASGGSTPAPGSSQSAVALGGNGGCYGLAVLDVTPGDTISIIVGVGGASPAAGSNPGLTGGTTYIGSTIVLPGGTPGAYGRIFTPPACQSPASVTRRASGCLINGAEIGGAPAMAGFNSNLLGGAGGNGPWGGAGGGGIYDGQPGVAGLAPGAGGGGSVSGAGQAAARGGAGVDGLVRIIY